MKQFYFSAFGDLIFLPGWKKRNLLAENYAKIVYKWRVCVVITLRVEQREKRVIIICFFFKQAPRI